MKPINKRIINLSLFLFCIIFLQISQNISAQRSCRVEGKVINHTNLKSVEFATVSLQHLPDSAVVQGVMSDTSGFFRITDLPYGNYIAKISCLGYQKVVKDNILLNASQSLYNLGSISMEENATSINEVVVESERLKGTTEVDKTVYSINEKAIATATSGLELLRNVPAVQVDFQNNVTLEGSGKILILVDGKTRDKDFLAQLDPKSIDKIEVMTNPSVKYDADVTGVISIILKKEKKSGLSGRLEAEVPVTNRVYSNSSANLEYGYNRFRVFVSGNGHLEKWDIANPVYRKTDDGLKTRELIQDGNGTGHWFYGGINYGFDWFQNDRNTFNFYANYRPGNGGKLNLDLKKRILVNGADSSFFTTASNDNSSDESQYYSLFYKRNFNNSAQELTADLNYYSYDGTIDRNYTDQYYQPDQITKNGSSVFRYENGDNKREVAGLKLDYTHPLNSNVKAYLGYQTNIQWINNKYSTASDAPSTRFRYNENRQAFYGSLSGKIKDFSWQGGLRYELSYIDINQGTKTNYNCFLPQASMQQKITKTQTLKINYRRSIQRPGIDDLNPFVNQTDSFTISKGNPNLSPSYSNKVELNYSLQLGSSFLTPGIYCDYTTGNFQQVTNVIGKISETYVDNIGKGTEIGVNVSGSVNIAKWWQIYPYFCAFDKKTNAIDQYEIPGAEKLSWRTSFSNVFTLPKNIVLFNFVQYNSPYIIAENTNKRDPIYVFGVEKDVIKGGKGKITIITINPFMKRFNAQQTITSSNNYYQDSQLAITNISYLFTVKFTYIFQSGKTIQKLDRQKEIENDGARRVF